MRKITLLSVLLFAWAGSALAKVTPFQLALYHPAQVFDRRWDVYGVSLGVLYSKNRNVVGLSVNPLVSKIDGCGLGVGVAGIVNIVGGGFAGLLVGGLSNVVQGERGGGLQVAALVNRNNPKMNWVGLQVAGMYNTGGFTGIQIAGFANGMIASQVGGSSGGWSTWRSASITGTARGIQASLAGNMAMRVVGLQASLGMNHSGGDVVGIQVSAINFANSIVSGSQIGVVNIGASDAFLQGGIYNKANFLTGAQVGIINRAERGRGLQFGLVNYAKSLKGMQVGLVNILLSSKVKFLPIINAHF